LLHPLSILITAWAEACPSADQGERPVSFVSTGSLPRPICDHPVIPEAQQTFPSAHGEGQDAFQLVMFFLVRPVHHSRHEAEAAGVVGGGADAGLHKGARDGIHLMKAGISQAFLRGECVGGERCAERRQSECIARIKKTVRARLLLEIDECGGRREQRVGRSQAGAGQGIGGRGFCGC